MLTALLGILLQLLVSEVLGVFEVEASILLGIDQEVVCEFVIKVAKLEIGEVIFGGLFGELVERAFFAGDSGLLILAGAFVFGCDGIFRVAVVSDPAGLVVPRDLLVDNRVDVVALLCGLQSPGFLLLVKINRVFHQLVQQFNLLFINLVLLAPPHHSPCTNPQ